MKKGGKAECRKADRLKMGKRSFRSRFRIADKAGGNFRGMRGPQGDVHTQPERERARPRMLLRPQA